MKNILLLSFISLSLITNAQLTNGLIAHYNLDGNALDATSNQLNGTLNGPVSAANRDNVANRALSFDGVDDRVDLPLSNLLKPELPLTVAFWVNLNQAEAGNFYCSDYIDLEYYGFWIGITAARELHVNFGDGGAAGSSSRKSKVANTLLTLNEWHHVVFIIRSYNDMDIYIDCENAGGTYSGDGETSMLYSTSYSPRVFNSVANSTFSPVFLDGQMDDLMMWNRALTDSEIEDFCKVEPLGLENHALENIVIYPNPVNNILKIDNSLKELSRVTLINNEGKVIFTQNEKLESIDMTTFESGVYFLKIEDINHLTHTFKVIKN